MTTYDDFKNRFKLMASKNKHLSDRNMFPFLEKQGKDVTGKQKIKVVFESKEFADFDAINVMPLIYDEKKQHCNIMIFDHKKAMNETSRIVYIGKGQKFDVIFPHIE